MNLFNFLRFSSIEKKAKDDSVLFRLAQKKNGKFVLVNDKGTIVSPEFDWISNQVANIRMAESNGIMTYLSNENGMAKNSTLARVSNDSQEKPAVYAGADDNGMTQVFLNGEKNGTFIITSHELSRLFDELTAANKKGLRLAWVDGKVEVVSKNGLESYDSFDRVSEQDENGVRFGYTSNPEKEQELVSLLSQNFDKTSERYKDLSKFENNYKAVLQNDKQVLLNKNGNNIAGGMYYNISEPNALGEVIATRSKVKSNGSTVLVHEGKHYRKADDMHKVIDSTPIGIKAMKYDKDLNKNVVAGVNISKGIEIDEDVNRVLIALLKGEKPMPRFWKAIEENDKFNLLFEGVAAYQAKLDEIANFKPELANEAILKKQNLTKSLSTLMKRKVAGHRTYEMREDKKIDEKKTQIVGHEKNIANSSNVREKLSDAMNNFEK